MKFIIDHLVSLAHACLLKLWAERGGIYSSVRNYMESKAPFLCSSPPSNHTIFFFARSHFSDKLRNVVKCTRRKLFCTHGNLSTAFLPFCSLYSWEWNAHEIYHEVICMSNNNKEILFRELLRRLWNFNKGSETKKSKFPTPFKKLSKGSFSMDIVVNYAPCVVMWEPKWKRNIKTTYHGHKFV